MKKFLFIFLIFTTSVCFSQYAHPDYAKVHDKFFKLYSESLNAKEGFISFAKKTDGWYVQFVETDNDENKRSFLFWEKKTNKWQVLRFDPITEFARLNPHVFEIEDDRVPYMYRVSPMYGYDGWYQDVIDSLGDKNILSDTLLYALNKAYFNQLSAAFGNQYGDYLPADLLGGTQYPKVFSGDDLIEIKRRHDKVSVINKRMKAQNPSFETFIGSLSMQYANDVMDIYMRMYLYHSKEEALKYLEPDLYDPYILDFAKYTLQNCPPNAILFTYGDNDTYPLWYVQHWLGVRKDVAILNISLLNIPDYASMNRKYGVVDFSISEKTLFEENFASVVIENKEIKLRSREFNDFLKKDFSVKGSNTISGGIVSFEMDSKEYTADFSNYLLRGDIILLDIMYSNAGKRPICFTTTSYYFDNLFEKEIQGTWIKQVGKSGQDIALRLNEIWDKDYIISDYSQFKDHFSESHQRLTNAMVMDIGVKVKFLIADGKKSEAKKILTKLNDAYSPSVIKRDFYWMYIAANFGKLGDQANASKIMNQIITNQKLKMQNDPNDDGRMLNYLENIKESVVDGTYTF